MEVEKGDPLDRLKAGNERFAEGHEVHPHVAKKRRHELKVGGQHPFATVVACSDSRVPVEILFDQGIGDLFVMRVAGNVIDRSVLGTVEYAVEHLHCPLVVILGHSNCGAVTAAVEHVHDSPNINQLLVHIRGVADQTQQNHPELSGETLINAAVHDNVNHSIEDLVQQSPMTREHVGKGDVQLIGAVYDIDTGVVEWMGPHPNEATLVHASAVAN